MPKKICLDVDGVVLDPLPLKKKLVEEYFHGFEVEDMRDLHSDCFFKRASEKLYKEVSYKLYRDETHINLMYGVREFLRELLIGGWEIYLLSARGIEEREASKYLLKKFGITGVDAFIHPKRVFYVEQNKDKPAVLERMQPHIYVDDSLKKILEIQEIVNHNKFKYFVFDPLEVYTFYGSSEGSLDLCDTIPKNIFIARNFSDIS